MAQVPGVPIYIYIIIAPGAGRREQNRTSLPKTSGRKYIKRIAHTTKNCTKSKLLGSCGEVVGKFWEVMGSYGEVVGKLWGSYFTKNLFISLDFTSFVVALSVLMYCNLVREVGNLILS